MVSVYVLWSGSARQDDLSHWLLTEISKCYFARLLSGWGLFVEGELSESGILRPRYHIDVRGNASWRVIIALTLGHKVKQ